LKTEQQTEWLNILPHLPSVEKLLLIPDIFGGIEGVETKRGD
jgi:hypothetical protein